MKCEGIINFLLPQLHYYVISFYFGFSHIYYFVLF